MQRFFVSFPLTEILELSDPDIYHQLTRVLRAHPGDMVTLFSGDGMEYIYAIDDISKRSITLHLQDSLVPQTEPEKEIVLFQALPNKYEKIEYILQKGVEIGIRRFVFFRSDRSQKLIITPQKQERFSQIAREALEQCGGVSMPEILWHLEEKSLLSQQSSRDFPQIALDTIGDTRGIATLSTYNRLALWVGPEGGWSDDERSKMIQNSFIFARFGKRVLRTETAGIVIGFGFLNS